MRTPKTHRYGPGSYEVVLDRCKATVIRNDELRGPAKWVAYANWDKYTITDPVMTKREAVGHAKDMIVERMTDLVPCDDGQGPREDYSTGPAECEA